MDFGNEKGARFFSGVLSDCRRGYKHKLKHEILSEHKKLSFFFPMEVFKHWNCFPREVMEYPSLKTIQT